MEPVELTKQVTHLESETIERADGTFATVSIYFSEEVSRHLVGAMEFTWATHSGMTMKQVTNWAPLEQYETEAEARAIYQALLEKYSKRSGDK
ncbi:MAG: hypothetical protein JWM39_794 [Parcubacteria group bacterium]|jgi:hypothetical protein|nr:hypothetical protein [Parcubacteria group bacterium]